MHCLFVTIFTVLIIILQILLLFVVVGYGYFVVSYVQYIGKTACYVYWIAYQYCMGSFQIIYWISENMAQTNIRTNIRFTTIQISKYIQPSIRLLSTLGLKC